MVHVNVESVACLTVTAYQLCRAGQAEVNVAIKALCPIRRKRVQLEAGVTNIISDAQSTVANVAGDAGANAADDEGIVLILATGLAEIISDTGLAVVNAALHTDGLVIGVGVITNSTG